MYSGKVRQGRGEGLGGVLWQGKARQGKANAIFAREGSFSTAIFNSDIQLSFFSLSFSCFISVCPFVALLKATYVENSHIVLSTPY